MTEPSRRTVVTTVTIAMLAVVVVQGFGRFTFPLLLPDMANDLLGSYGAAGWSATANLLAYLTGVLLVSATAARLGAFRQLKIGLVLSVAGMGALAVAPTFGIVIAGMLLTGFASAFVWVPSTAVVSTVLPAGARGTALGLLATGAGIGIVVGSPLAGAVRDTVGGESWRAVWWVESALAAVVLIGALVALKPVPTHVAPRPGLAALRAVPRWPLIALAYGTFGLAFTLYSTYIISALEDDAGMSTASATRMYTVLGCASVVGGVAAGRLSDHVGRRVVLFGCGVALAVAPALVPTGVTFWLVVSVILFGLVLTAFGAVGAVLVSDHVHPSEVASALGAIVVALSVAQLVAPPIGGWLADHTGSFTATFALASFVGAICAAASATVIERDFDDGDGDLPLVEELAAPT